MQDTELYRELLGLKTPWRGTGVELEVKRAAGRFSALC